MALFAPNRICAVIAAPTAAEASRQFRAAVRGGSRALELRLDYLQNSAERTALLKLLTRQTRRLTVIATCRGRRGGGRFSGTAAAELAILAQAVRAGHPRCNMWCDVALETAEHFSADELHEALAPARLLISAHDFRRVPRDLRGLTHRLERCGADALKIAAACRSLSDARRLFALAQRNRRAVVVPMGEDLLAARILALREGSALAYAAVDQTTAPGQLSLDEMQHTYRLARRFGAGTAGPTRRTPVYAVIGTPIGHSLSPLMQNAALAARGVNAIFLPFRVPVGAAGLRDFIASVKPLGIAGFAVTLPHKQAILRHLDGRDPLAAEIGAVNTVVVRGGGRLYGYNTDYVGVLRAIESRLPLRASRVLLFGAGGAARAAAFALSHAGAVVVVCARREAKARALARDVGGLVVDRKMLPDEYFDAIVNCTPIGMHPGGGSPLEPRELNCRVVMDLIYRPRKTELLHLAERRGIDTVSGVEMFLAQGMAQWEIWNGERAPEAVMRRAVDAALGHEERKASHP